MAKCREVVMQRRRGALVVAAALALAGAGCGDDDDSSKARATPTTASSQQTGLEKFLLKDGEEPGFERGAQSDARPSALQTLTGVDAFATEMRLSPQDKARLQSEGFISFTVAPIRGVGNDSAGLTNVALYATAAGAAKSLAHDLKPDVIQEGGPLQGLRFFDVPGVPGARGWSATEPPVANVAWVEGRCYLVLGNQGSGSLSGPLTAAVQAMHARIAGHCP
jgi:hypothetical protein